MGVFRKKVTVHHGLGTSSSTVSEKYVANLFTKISVPVAVVVAALAAQEVFLEKPLSSMLKRKASLEDRLPGYTTTNANKVYREGTVGYIRSDGKDLYVIFPLDNLSKSTSDGLEKAVDVAISGLPKGEFIVTDKIMEGKRRVFFTMANIDQYTNLPALPTEEELATKYNEHSGHFSPDYKSFITDTGQTLEVNYMTDIVKAKAKGYMDIDGKMRIYYCNTEKAVKGIFSSELQKVGELYLPKVPGIRFELRPNTVKPA